MCISLDLPFWFISLASGGNCSLGTVKRVQFANREVKLAQRYYGLRCPQMHSKLSHSKPLYLKRELCQQRGLWGWERRYHSSSQWICRFKKISKGTHYSQKMALETLAFRKVPGNHLGHYIWGVCWWGEDWKGKETITVFLTLAPLLKALSRELGQGKF